VTDLIYVMNLFKYILMILSLVQIITLCVKSLLQLCRVKQLKQGTFLS